MRTNLLIAIIITNLATSAPLSAQQTASGNAQRDYRGRTYTYQPIVYYAPVWYAGNGIVRSNTNYGAPAWPGMQTYQGKR